MPSFCFIHAADLHFDSGMAGLGGLPEGSTLRAKLQRASRDALTRLVKLAVDRRAKFVLACGDLFDGDWSDGRTGLAFVEALVPLKRASIPFIYIEGNHDAQGHMTLRLNNSLEHIIRLGGNRGRDSQCSHEMIELGVVLHGVSYAVREEKNNLLSLYPCAHSHRLNIGLLHTALEGDVAHATYAPTTVGELNAKGYDYWALGHVHQRRIVQEGGPGAPWIVFPGNIQGRHAKETAAAGKGVSVVTVDNDRIVSVEHVAVDTVRWFDLTVNLSPANTLDDVSRLVKSALEQALHDADGRAAMCRVRLTGELAAHRELVALREQMDNSIRQLAVSIDSDALGIEKVRFETRPAVGRSPIEGDPAWSLIHRYDVAAGRTEGIAPDNGPHWTLPPELQNTVGEKWLRDALPQAGQATTSWTKVAPALAGTEFMEIAHKGVSPADIADELRRVLGASMTVQTPASAADSLPPAAPIRGRGRPPKF